VTTAGRVVAAVIVFNILFVLHRLWATRRIP
jgi:hypothetical protein